jgi:ABC-type nitrate/sulfonate/bicarbonate transport system substrate-binding protein
MFSGASSLPIVAAEHLGLFARSGLDVDIELTRSSGELMEGLAAGRYEVVHAAPGNFVAWRDRTGDPVLAWLGGTSGPLRLMAAPGTATVQELAGRQIAVDSVASGFVSVLRRILRWGGLGDDDVELVPLGSTELRFGALRAGETAATMLTLPWAAVAAGEGFVALADQDDVLPRLQGSCAASLEPFLESDADSVDAYTRALCAALTWLDDPRNAEEGSTLVAERYGIDRSIADEVRRSIMDPRSGWIPSAMIDPLGMEMVCELRAENGDPPRQPASSYYTLGPYRRVMGFGLLESG